MRSAYWQTGVDAAGGRRLQRFTFQMQQLYTRTKQEPPQSTPLSIIRTCHSGWLPHALWQPTRAWMYQFSPCHRTCAPSFGVSIANSCSRRSRCRLGIFHECLNALYATQFLCGCAFFCSFPRDTCNFLHLIVCIGSFEDLLFVHDCWKPRDPQQLQQVSDLDM